MSPGKISGAEFTLKHLQALNECVFSGGLENVTWL